MTPDQKRRVSTELRDHTHIDMDRSSDVFVFERVIRPLCKVIGPVQTSAEHETVKAGMSNCINHLLHPCNLIWKGAGSTFAVLKAGPLLFIGLFGLIEELKHDIVVSCKGLAHRLPKGDRMLDIWVVLL